MLSGTLITLQKVYTLILNVDLPFFNSCYSCSALPMVKSMALHDSRSGRVTDCRRIALCFICLLLNVLFLTSLGAFSINVLLMATDFGSLMPIEILFLVTVSEPS